MNQLCMFENEIKIPGLLYLPKYITVAQELELIRIIDTKPWITELKRKVQHYGYKYDYKSRNLDPKYYIGFIPDWLHGLCKKLHVKEIFSQYPQQVIVNEYMPGQGISSHVDCIPCFGNTVCSLSLGSPCVMDFTNNSIKQSILLAPRSLLILRNDARYLWKYGIAGRKNDKYCGSNISRKRRLSLTFRTVILQKDNNLP